MANRAYDDESDKLLEEACNVVKQQAMYMNAAIYKGDLEESIKFAFNMLCELRTGRLGPTKYYTLYIAVTNELRNLEEYFWNLHRENKKTMIEVYELVQYKANVLPRLYLLITAGNVYIRSKEAASKDILKDMVEMCKGVQHPIRGLFVRNYLSRSTVDCLPDSGSEYEGHGGNIHDAVDFVSQNFYEMNSLWVRMQKLKLIKDKVRREQERQDLSVLVGTNIVRLSELEGVDIDMYRTKVLPKILETIIESADQISQFYLMDCIIQRFSDDYHLHTLEMYLEACTKLCDGVDVKELLISFMNRLSSYAANSGTETPSMPSGVNAFKLFVKYINKILETRPDLTIPHVLSLQVALLEFTVKFYGANLAYVDHILDVSSSVLNRMLGSSSEHKVDSDAVKYVVELLTQPQNVLSIEVLKLNSYTTLMAYLRFDSRKTVAVQLLRAVIDNSTILSNAEIVEQLCNFISPLVKDEDDSPDDSAINADEFDAEQNLVCRMVHLIQTEDQDELFKCFVKARSFFGQGGTRRIKATLTPLIFRALQLAAAVVKAEKAGNKSSSIDPRKAFKFVHDSVTALATKYPIIALRLFLQAAVVADSCLAEPIAYEYFSQAFILYEFIAESKDQVAAINIIIATLYRCFHFSDHNYLNLTVKTTQYSGKLVELNDQCRMKYQCAHLFWNPKAYKWAIENKSEEEEESEEPRGAPKKNGDNVWKCFKTSLISANQSYDARPENVILFVELANKYTYFFDKQCEQLNWKVVEGMFQYAKVRLECLDASDAYTATDAYLKNSLSYVKPKKPE